MVQWVKVAAPKAEGLSSIPRIHTMEGETAQESCFLTSTCVLWHVYRHTRNK